MEMRFADSMVSVEECSIRSSAERVSVGMPVSEGEKNGKSEAGQLHRATLSASPRATNQTCRQPGNEALLAADAKPSTAEMAAWLRLTFKDFEVCTLSVASQLYVDDIDLDEFAARVMYVQHQFDDHLSSVEVSPRGCVQ